MVIKVDDFAEGESKNVSFSEKISIPKAYSVNKDAIVNISGEILKKKEKFVFNGKAAVKLNVSCDLCLESFDIDINFDVYEVFVKAGEKIEGKNDEESDFNFFSGKFIDFEPVILNNIIMNIPMKTVCSENCKGMCSICGHNLNKGECGCDRTYINPEFERLRTLFEENDEEV